MKKFVEIQGHLINTDHIIRIEPIGRARGVNQWHPAIRLYTIVGTLPYNATRDIPLEFWVGNPQSSEESAIDEAGGYLRNLFSDSIISPSLISRHRS